MSTYEKLENDENSVSGNNGATRMNAITEQPRSSSNAEPILLSSFNNSTSGTPAVATTSLLPLPEIALHSEKNECTCFGCLRCIYSCCCRLDCISELTLFQAISRYEEEFVLTTQYYVEKLTKNHFMVSILETLYMSYPEYFFTYLPTGSLREGFGKLVPSSSVLATDHDIMLVPDAVTIGELGANYQNETPVFSAIDAPKDHLAGYLWLKLEDKYLTQWEKLCLRRHVGVEGCSLLSSSKWREMLRQTLQCSMALRYSTHKASAEKVEDIHVLVENNGPALTVEVSATSEGGCFRGRETRKHFYADFTLGLHCITWPEKAKGFFKSEFRANWPPKEAVDTILKLGCHVVPKSSTHQLVKLTLEQAECTTFGRSPGLEWRYSFSQPEIILSKYIPSPAKTAYLAFKAIVKKHFNKVQGKICSFALKCIMYRVVEKKEKDFWKMTTDIVEQIFTEMLEELNNDLHKGYCRNYWIPQINLFDELTPNNLLYKRAFMEQVLKDPKKYVVDEWLEYARCVRLNCCYCGQVVRNSGGWYTMVQGQYQQEDSGCCICFRCKYSYTDTSCCSSHLYRTDPLSLDVY